MKERFIYRKDCHFFMEGTKKNCCTALRNFYNYPDVNMCGQCPFHKTHEEFKRGFYNAIEQII